MYCNRAAMEPLVELYGRERAAAFTPPMLRAVREAMVEKGWVRDTVNAHVARIVRAFAWAATEVLVPAAVHAALALVQPIPAGRRDDLDEGETVEPVPADHVAAVLVGEHLHHKPERRAVLAAAIRVHVLTGMRPGELCSLRCEAIDRTKTPWRYEIAEFNKMLHKDIKRVAFFGPEARAILSPLLGAAGPVFVLPPARVNAKPCPLTPASYREYIRAACESAGVPEWTPNRLRHNRATYVMDKFEDDKAAAAALGNTPEVARQVYAKNPGEEVARRIAELTG